MSYVRGRLGAGNVGQHKGGMGNLRQSMIRSHVSCRLCSRSTTIGQKQERKGVNSVRPTSRVEQGTPVLRHEWP